METNQQTIAVIGVGSMGSAIIKGLVNTNQFNIIGENPDNPRVTKLQQDLGFTVVNNNQELSQLPVSTTVISAAAGVSLKELQSVITDATVATMIPNTPVAVNAGTIGLALPEEITDKKSNKIIAFLKLLGDVIPVSENQLDIVGVIGGCGPAFVDVFMDAMSDGAVANGMSRQTAYRLISSMVKGTGKLAFDTNKLPAELRDQVTSPAGTTIKGVMALEKNQFRYAVIDAINKAAGK